MRCSERKVVLWMMSKLKKINVYEETVEGRIGTIPQIRSIRSRHKTSEVNNHRHNSCNNINTLTRSDSDTHQNFEDFNKYYRKLYASVWFCSYSSVSCTYSICQSITVPEKVDMPSGVHEESPDRLNTQDTPGEKVNKHGRPPGGVHHSTWKGPVQLDMLFHHHSTWKELTQYLKRVIVTPAVYPRHQLVELLSPITVPENALYSLTCLVGCMRKALTTKRTRSRSTWTHRTHQEKR